MTDSDGQHSSWVDPSVVLIGGEMTLEDGSSLDSRQQVEGDRLSVSTLSTLATSPAWWSTVISVVRPVLDTAGPDAYALVLGSRTVTALRADGTLRRRSLRPLLPGGNTNLELIRVGPDDPLPAGYTEVGRSFRFDGRTPYDKNDHGSGALAYRTERTNERWVLLTGGEWYLKWAGPDLHPTVIVDTKPPAIMDDTYSSYLADEVIYTRLFASTVLVVPHTAATEKLFRLVADRMRTGQVGINPPIDYEPQPAVPWDPNTRPDPINYTTFVPAGADFGVTGLVRNAEWADPADLESARELLQARYDLKIGIWDLVDNPVLRRTLLDSTPISAAPAAPAAVPGTASKRADRRVEERQAERAEAAAALKALEALVKPVLAPLGWRHEHPGGFRLELTPRVRRWSEEEPEALVFLYIEVLKRKTSAGMWFLLYNQIDLRKYLARHHDELVDIAGDGEYDLGRESWPVLWAAPGGWADQVDWRARAELLAMKTPRWAAAFRDLAEQCMRKVPR